MSTARPTVLIVALVTVIAGLGVRARQPPADLVIANVTVIDAAGTPPVPRTLVVRGGRIDALLDPGSKVPAETTIDGGGKYVIPGLWDMHVHLGTRPEPGIAERTMLPMFLAAGIVGIRDMGGTGTSVIGLRDRVRKGDLEGPRILAPGPFLDGPGDADPMYRRVTDPAGADAAIRELADAGADFAKVQANLSADAYAAIVRAARARQMTVAGHIPVSITAADAIAAGQRSIEHISPALVGDAVLLFACSSREAALRSELLAIERERPALKPDMIRAREAALRRELIATYDPARAAALGRTLRDGGTWIVPTLIWSNTFRPLTPNADGREPALDRIPEEIRTHWLANRARYLKTATPEMFADASAAAKASARAVGALHAAGARVLAGTDTLDAFVLPGTSLHAELALLVDAGLTPLEALQTATRNAAEYRGELASEGTVAPGKTADLVVLARDPLADIRNVASIEAVVMRGKRVKGQIR